MPTPSLPPSPPAVVQPASNQSQSQEQSQYNAPNISSSNSNNAGANSATESTGVLNQSGSLENIQVNNSNSGIFEFGIGTSAPTPTISTTVYSSGGNTGFATTLVIPLGGAVGRQHRRLIDSRVKRIDLDNSAIALQSELELAQACAKIAASGVAIDYNLFPILARCKYVTVRPIPAPILLPPPPPPIQMLVPPVTQVEPPLQTEPKRPVRGLW